VDFRRGIKHFVIRQIIGGRDGRSLRRRRAGRTGRGG
jgi:hypothetical protein